MKSEHNFTELILSFHLFLWAGTQVPRLVPKRSHPPRQAAILKYMVEEGEYPECSVGVWTWNPPEFVNVPSLCLAITKGLMDQVCLLVNSMRSRGFS